ncbi:hypothetical protein CIB84_017589, partial [Bambusicola thoracicus]
MRPAGEQEMATCQVGAREAVSFAEVA